MTQQPTFKDRNYAERKNGDSAYFYYSESKFEQHWPGPHSHFGLGADTEDMATYKLSKFMSHAPDYIAAFDTNTQPFLVEVQGTGLGGAEEDGTITHKFKQSKLDVLTKWNTYDEVAWWLWNDDDQTWCMTSHASLRLMIARGLGTQGLFDGKRPYWALPVQTIIDNSDYDRLLDKYG